MAAVEAQFTLIQPHPFGAGEGVELIHVVGDEEAGRPPYCLPTGGKDADLGPWQPP